MPCRALHLFSPFSWALGATCSFLRMANPFTTFKTNHPNSIGSTGRPPRKSVDLWHFAFACASRPCKLCLFSHLVGALGATCSFLQSMVNPPSRRKTNHLNSIGSTWGAPCQVTTCGLCACAVRLCISAMSRRAGIRGCRTLCLFSHLVGH